MKKKSDVFPLLKEVRRLSVADVRVLSLIDSMGVGDYTGTLCLSEYSRQSYHRYAPRVYDVTQHVPRPHAGQLVHVTDKDQPHVGWHRLQQ